MARILAVGIATLDIINTTDGFPEEDSEVRAIHQDIRRGGNATNSLVVLNQLGHHCAWLGTQADDIQSELIYKNLDTHHIDYSLCTRISGSKTPTSYITLNSNNGSRTIVHYRELPELTLNDFNKVNFEEFDWLHFEGRHPNVYGLIIARLAKQKNPANISVEIEKDRKHLNDLFIDGVTYIFSRQFALQQHFSTAHALLHSFQRKLPNSLLVCTWGHQGSFAVHKNTQYHADAKPIDSIVDSIGAGDTFNAGLIDRLLRGYDVQTSLIGANALAAIKCQLPGFDKLSESINLTKNEFN